jgi:hypothetical protein
MLTPRESLSQTVFEPGPDGDRARQVFGDAYTKMMKREWYTIGIHLGFRYEGSSIVIPDGTPEPEDTVSTYVQTARPGHRAPHVWLSPEQSTLDLFGRDFVLFRFENGLGVDGLVTAAKRAGVPLTVVDIDHEQARALYESKLVLVRPDGHVAWRDDVEPEDSNALIDIVRGAQPLSVTNPALEEVISR